MSMCRFRNTVLTHHIYENNMMFELNIFLLILLVLLYHKTKSVILYKKSGNDLSVIKKTLYTVLCLHLHMFIFCFEIRHLHCTTR